MDKICNEPEVEELNKTNAEDMEFLKNRASPVFKCFNHTKTIKGSHLDSSDYDIPSYQINQSCKSRSSSKYGNETSESILPFTPIFSPISVASPLKFQPHGIHSLGTVAKNDNSGQNKTSNSSNCARRQSVKSGGIFESLGMTDKDISWVSSMATPPPKNVHGSEFNTIEKATFIPEEKFQNIQPRALFSPTLDNDSGCHPIIFTSESDDNDNEEYKSNIRLSDVCATLKQLEVKSLDLALDKSVEKSFIEKDQVISPIIRTKKRKVGSVKKKKKCSLVMSPEHIDKYEFSLGENLKTSECEKVRSNSVGNFVEDDLFQSISFSGIDELCKTLVSEPSKTSMSSKQDDCNKTPTALRENTVKKFYSTKATSDIFTVSSMDNLHSYAKALEEGDKCNSRVCKIEQPFPKPGIVRFDVLNKNIPKTDATKRLHSEIIEDNDQCREKKLKKVSEDNSNWENVKQYLSESQLNISDGEMFRTVENLEKTLASQENKLEKLSGEESQGLNKEGMTVKCVSDLLESNGKKNMMTKNFTEDLITGPFMVFTTASGSKITVSEEALNKGKDILRDCDENLHKDSADRSYKQISKPGQQMYGSEEFFKKKGFSTDLGQQVNASAEVLMNERTLWSDCTSDVMPQKFEDNLSRQLFTGSRKHICISKEALEKASTFVSEFSDYEKEQFGDVASTMEGFSTGSGRKIQVSAKTLERAKALMAECYENEEDYMLKNSTMNSKKLISTKTTVFSPNSDKISKEKVSKPTTKLIISSGKKIQVSMKALERAKALMADCEEGAKENLSIFKGFSAGSGKSNQMSDEAAEKARSLWTKCEPEVNESSKDLACDWELKNQSVFIADGSKSKIFHDKKEPDCSNICFSTALGNQIKVSSKALEKAKELWTISADSPTKVPGSSSKAFAHTEPPLMGFITAAGSQITISKTALAKAKERMNDWDQIKPEHSVNFDCATDTDGTKTSMRKASEITGKISKSDVGKTSNIWETNESDDWNEIIPNWLHVYNTSPSIATERIELSPFVCDEGGKASNPVREYIVKSPVLGSRDRFHGKTKKRKLHFEDQKESHGKTEIEFVNKNADEKTSVKKTPNLILDFSIPFKKFKFMEDFSIISVNVKLERARARAEQEKVIKEKQNAKPMKGSHLSRKYSEKQMSWKEAVAGSSPEVHSEKVLKSFGVCEDVLQINIENAVSCRLNGEDFFGSSCTKNIEGVPVGDRCLLILDDDNKFGLEEVKRAFLASPGVQPNLIPQGWTENHFKWIIWKLAHYERCFPKYFGGSCLTANNIMLQLKYRYDREIDRNERSALKKILERDDTSIKRLVLCICGIQKVTVGEATGYKLELTDGWYSCSAHSDPAMTRLIEEGKLHIGTKLVTQGAILLNCDQGVSPLENNGNVYLKISTNSTRRIRWDTKLGFQKNPENFPISLGSILPQGGPITRVDVIIVRIYPILYMEKTSDGRHVTRNRRSEEKADSEYRRIQEQRMESICNEVQSELRKSTNLDRNLKRNCLNTMEKVEDSRQLVESSSDPTDSQDERNPLRGEEIKTFLNISITLSDCRLTSNVNDYLANAWEALKEPTADLNSDQRKFIENDRFNRELREKIEKELEKEKLNKRNVSEFLRAKIVDFRKPDFNNPAILSIWNPYEDLTTLLSEGKVISIMNVTVSNSSRLYKPLQINTTRQTKYRQIVRNVKYPARKLTKLRDVSSKVCPAFEEVDIVGLVALIRDVSYGSRLSQVVYLTDLEMNFVGIVFWGSCKDYGWENVLRTPSIVACSNLQWKKNHSHQSVPSLYVNDNSVFTENPKHVYLKEEIERLKQNMPQDKTKFLSKCEEDLAIKLEDSKWQANTSKNSCGNDSNPREATTSRIINGFETKPTASSTPIKPFSASMDSNEAEPSPIHKRIERLQAYGEPPSLIPLIVRNNAKRKFKKKT